jgi:hypothetical protein
MAQKKHCEIKTGFSPVDLLPLVILPKAWRNKNGSILGMRRIFLLVIFNHSGLDPA